MKYVNYKKELILWVLLLVPFICMMYMWDALPDRIPIHFGISGKPNGWSGKWGVFILPFVNVLAYFILLLIPVIDPKRMSIEFFYSNFYKIRLCTVFFMCLFSVLPVIAGLNGPSHAGPNWIFLLPFTFFAVMGNFMINVKPNWFAGIRTPWTLSSDTVWKKTHQVFGRLWFYGGLTGAALAFFLPTLWTIRLLGVFALTTAILAYVYSFWLFKLEKKNKNGNPEAGIK